MSRYFANITQKDLMDKIDGCDSRNPKHLTPQVEADLDKVEFDTENISDSTSDAWGWKNKQSLLGYRTLDNGLTFLGVNAGGDWEVPIFFIIYWDGKKLRGYIPTEGNTWNTISKVALGNGEESDIKYLSKLFPQEYADFDKKGQYWKDSFVSIYKDRVHLDKDLLEKDIKARILPAQAATKPSQAIKIVKKDIYDELKDLTYYGMEDEGLELWQSLCESCYKLWSLNGEDKARIILVWLKEMAKESKKWCLEEFGSLDEVSSWKGR
jgi:hypothetical protein